jgi:hypothetical protein
MWMWFPIVSSVLGVDWLPWNKHKTQNTTDNKSMNKQSILMALAGILSLAGSANAVVAQTLTPLAPGDTILSFRQVVNGTPSASDLEVNIGNIANYSGMNYSSAASVVNIGQYSGANLSGLFGGLDNLSWSVASSVYSDPADITATGKALSTLWVTKARVDVNAKTTPFVQKTVFSQGAVSAKIQGIKEGMVSPSATPVSSTAVTIADSAANSYHTFVGSGNYGGTFQASVENSTGTGFTGVSRSDLYQLTPGTGAGAYLGFFELSAATGDMSFTPVPEPAMYGLLAGLGLLVISMNSQFRRIVA